MKAHICNNPERFNIHNLSYGEVLHILDDKTSASMYCDKQVIYQHIRQAILCMGKLSSYGDCKWLAHVKHRYTENDHLNDYVVIVDYNADTDVFHVIMDDTDKFGWYRLVSVAPLSSIENIIGMSINSIQQLAMAAHYND